MSKQAANIIINDNGKILLLLRSTGWKTGYWGPPGGIADEGESPKDAVIREVFEETGLTIEEEHLNFLMAKTKSDFGIIWFYATDRFSGDIKISWEHEKYAWLELEELNAYDVTFEPSEIEMIKNYFLMNP